MTAQLVRLAVISGYLCVESVPGYWIQVATVDDFSAQTVATKVFLIQSALKDKPDFPHDVLPNELR